MDMLGSIEAGGTKFVCAVSDSELTIIERISFPTTSPVETLAKVIDFFKKYDEKLKAIGIGSFGPIDCNPQSEKYGWVTSTPKPGWTNFDFLGEMKVAFKQPMYWTTDVNAACYGEVYAGGGLGLSSVVYYTIGTGIGAGAIQNGKFIGGINHTEMGHMMVPKNPNDDYSGTCPYHQDCLEGLAAGPAIEARSGIKGQDLAPDSPYWELEAEYLAKCLYNTTLMLSPERIILGGGVMGQKHLLPMVREKFKELLNGYVETPEMATYIITPVLENNAATIGCLALAKQLLVD